MAVNPLSWSTTPASNSTIDSINIAEGCQPSVLNNAIRSHMAGVKELTDLIMGAKTSGGTANAQTLTSGLSLSSLTAGTLVAFKAGATNTTAMTLAVDSIGATNVKLNDGSTDPYAGAVTAGGIYLCATDGTSWLLLNPGVGGIPPLTATLLCADNILDQPVLRDYGETLNAIGSIGGGTQDIDLESGNVVSATVDTSTTTFTFSNPPASGTAGSFTLFLTNGGSQTVNWPASVDWAGGTAPSLTSSGVDILTFTTIDGGTIWYGFAAGLDMS